MQDKLEVESIGPDTLDEMRSLLSSEPDGWCWCVAWEVASFDGWTERTEKENRALRERLWSEGEYHGYVFRVAGKPVGWCRAAPLSVWPKMMRMRSVEDEPGLRAIGCITLKPAWRKKQLAHAFLKLVVADLRDHSVREIVAFPKRSDEDLPDGAVWNGPASLFLKAGFQTRRTEKTYTEMRMNLE